MEILFWAAIGAVLWSYVGYPALLLVVARVRKRELRIAAIEPTVSVIVAVHNEEHHIGQKLESTYNLQYPQEKLEVIVAADGCTDNTHSVVEGFSDRGTKLIVLPEREGKTAAQNVAARVGRGEILIFTDATTQLLPDAITRLVEAFADARVGCVGGNLEYVSEGGTAVGKGVSAYWLSASHTA